MTQKTGGWTTVVIGTVLLIAGLAWGLIGSHQISYENSQQNITYRIGTGTTSGNVYIHADGSNEYFVALSDDFTPPIARSDIDNSTAISFVARTDTTSIDLDVNGTTINEAHKIEKLVFLDKNGGTMATYTTAEYNANPNGVYASVWSDAGWLVGFSLLLVVAGLIQALRAPKTNFSIGGGTVPPYRPMPPSYPPAQTDAPYAPTNPYSQAYQGPSQYPSANPYAQPSNNPNPYQQPPQG